MLRRGVRFMARRVPLGHLTLSDGGYETPRRSMASPAIQDFRRRAEPLGLTLHS